MHQLRLFISSSKYYEFSRKVINIVFLLSIDNLVCYILNKLLFIGNYTFWIDVCPTDSNLLASGGEGMNIKIYDRLESRIVKTIDDIHSGKNCLIISD